MKPKKSGFVGMLKSVEIRDKEISRLHFLTDTYDKITMNLIRCYNLNKKPTIEFDKNMVALAEHLKKSRDI